MKTTNGNFPTMFVLFFPLIILTISYLSIFIFISYFSHLYYTLVDKKEKKSPLFTRYECSTICLYLFETTLSIFFLREILISNILITKNCFLSNISQLRRHEQTMCCVMVRNHFKA